MTNKHTGRRSHNSPAQLANLRNFADMDPEEHRMLSARGGKKNAELYHQRKTFKQAVELIMSMPAFESRNEAVNMLKKKFPELSNTEAMTVALVDKILQDGDAKAYAVLRDTSGELPAQTVNVANDEPLEINIKTVE